MLVLGDSTTMSFLFCISILPNNNFMTIDMSGISSPCPPIFYLTNFSLCCQTMRNLMLWNTKLIIQWFRTSLGRK